MPQLTNSQKIFLAAVGTLIAIFQIYRFIHEGLEGTGWSITLAIATMLLVPAVPLLVTVSNNFLSKWKKLNNNKKINIIIVLFITAGLILGSIFSDFGKVVKEETATTSPSDFPALCGGMLCNLDQQQTTPQNNTQTHQQTNEENTLQSENQKAEIASYGLNNSAPSHSTLNTISQHPITNRILAALTTRADKLPNAASNKDVSLTSPSSTAISDGFDHAGMNPDGSFPSEKHTQLIQTPNGLIVHTDQGVTPTPNQEAQQTINYPPTHTEYAPPHLNQTYINSYDPNTETQISVPEVSLTDSAQK
ncbi:MAG: hypothetical protein KGI50_06325 [Patescibacteria group bacterium]|nr:hypothetical protein [Patescibacteria group bacterium]